MNLLSNNPAPKGAQRFLQLLLIFSAICFAVSSTISTENTAEWPLTATNDGIFSEKYNEWHPAMRRGREHSLRANASESGPIGTNSELKTVQSSIDPGTFKTALVIYFKNNQALFSAASGISGITFDESALWSESQKSTTNWPQMAADGALFFEKYNEMNSTPLRGRRRLFLADTSESDPISVNSESKTRQSSNNPSSNIDSLAIYFNDKHEFSLPLLCILTVSQQSKVRISKIYENLPEAAAHTARADGAPFILAKTRYVLQPLTAGPLCCRKNFSQNVTQSWTIGDPSGGASNPAQLNRTASRLYQPNLTARMDYQPNRTARIDYQPVDTARIEYQPVDTARIDYQPNRTARIDYQPNCPARIEYQPVDTARSHCQLNRTAHQNGNLCDLWAGGIGNLANKTWAQSPAQLSMPYSARPERDYASPTLASVNRPAWAGGIGNQWAGGIVNLASKMWAQPPAQLSLPHAARAERDPADPTLAQANQPAWAGGINNPLVTWAGGSVDPASKKCQHQAFTNVPPGLSRSGQNWVAAPEYSREPRQLAQTRKAASNKVNPIKAQRSIHKECQMTWPPEATSGPAHEGPNGVPVLGAADRAHRQTPLTSKAVANADNLTKTEGQRLTELLSPSPTIRPSG